MNFSKKLFIVAIFIALCGCGFIICTILKIFSPITGLISALNWFLMALTWYFISITQDMMEKTYKIREELKGSEPQ